MRLNTLAMAIAVGAVVVSVPVLGTASPAQAHNYLVSSTPADGATLTELPAQFEVTTNGPLLTIGGATSGFALEVRDSAGLYYGDGCVAVDGASMTATAALGEPGEYTMLWQVVSSDGHSVSGEVPFTWAPDGEYPVQAGSATIPDCSGTVQVTAPNPTASSEADSRNVSADLGDVLWIGGAIGAVLVAGLVTLVIVGRKRPDQPKEKA